MPKSTSLVLTLTLALPGLVAVGCASDISVTRGAPADAGVRDAGLDASLPVVDAGTPPTGDAAPWPGPRDASADATAREDASAATDGAVPADAATDSGGALVDAAADA